jgi:sugar/nucleoside kinase (ribokinase family)
MFDIAFLGHICFDETVNHDGSESICAGGAALYGAMAAATTQKKIAAVVMLAPKDHECLKIMIDRGIEVITIDSEQTTRVRVVHKSENVDQRHITTVAYAGAFETVPNISARWIHLAGCNDHEFTIDFIRQIKDLGTPISVDMQSFVRYNSQKSGEVTFNDYPQKASVVELMDCVKLDVLEAKLLTGTDDIEKAARIVNEWGCPEVMITRSDGVLLISGGKTFFEKFTNRTSVGRTGRGDTTFGAYLARRLDYGPAEALKFAAALVSLKMENPTPFMGSLEQVLTRKG